MTSIAKKEKVLSEVEYIGRKDLFKFLDSVAEKLKEKDDYQSQVGALTIYSLKAQLEQWPYLLLSFKKGDS